MLARILKNCHSDVDQKWLMADGKYDELNEWLKDKIKNPWFESFRPSCHLLKHDQHLIKK